LIFTRQWHRKFYSIIRVKDLLDESQEKLVTLLKKQDDSMLDQAYSEKATYRDLIEGIFQHDLYHLGQIAYIKSNHSGK